MRISHSYNQLKHCQKILPNKQSLNISTAQEFAKLLQNQPPNNNPISYFKAVHSRIIVSGMIADTFLANLMLQSYSKSHCVGYARKVFDTMCERNLVSWSSVISMYTRNAFNEEAWMVFCEFQRGEGCCKSGNEYILASVVRACTHMGGGVCKGGLVHGFVVKTGFDREVYVGTALVDFYAKSGGMEEARKVFEGLEERSTVTWTAVMSGYVKSGRSDVALELFNGMWETGVSPDRYVLSSALSACSALRFVEGGKQIHGYALRRGTEMDISVANVLIDFYIKCGRVQTARKLFDPMTVKNVISWTTMISGYMQNSYDLDAVRLFVEMARSGLKPDSFACTSVLTSCGSLEAIKEGRVTHAYIIKANLEHDDFVINSLVDMYAKCDSLTEARKVFDITPDRNVITFNALIEGYSKQEQLHEALDLFHMMRINNVSPNLLTFVSILGISAALYTLQLSKQIHGLTIKFGDSLNNFACSALIDVYSKCSCIEDARLVFEETNDKDIVVWNSMFFGYTQQLENEKALNLYSKFQLSPMKPNEFTLAALVTASSNLASLHHGQQFHSQVLKRGLDFDPIVINALVDMYAKCGCIEEANKTFKSRSWRDVVSWNSMISTYAHHGEAEEALRTFDEMIKKGVKPSYVTFVGVLSACSHAGLVQDGLLHFESMLKFGIEPGTEHYVCMVSLLGRAGKLQEALELVQKMPEKPAAVAWRSLLSACRITGNVELGKFAAEMAISLEPTDSGSFVLLSNILASKGMWKEVKQVRERMVSAGALKEPGRSWIELNNKVNVFVAKDKTHQQADLIFSVLDSLMFQVKVLGYAPNFDSHLVND